MFSSSGRKVAVAGKRRRWGTLAAVLAVTALCLAAVGRGAGAAEPQPVQVTAAPPLAWGFKGSWRNYAPGPQVSGGAAVVAAQGGGYGLEWAFAAGSYDEATRTTTLAYQGTVHWEKYRASELNLKAPSAYTGSDPDPYILDVTIADPQITIGSDGATLTALAKSRERATWNVVDYGRVPIVALDVFGLTPAVAGGTTAWAGIGATVASAGSDVFGGGYLPGATVDPISFSYSGPGGAPDLSEHFDLQGAARLKLVENQLLYEADSPINAEIPPWVDRQQMIVHEIFPVEVGGVPSRRLQAFDLTQMKPLGTPLTLPSSQVPDLQFDVLADDTSQGRLLYHLPGETGITHWLGFDEATEQYEFGDFTDPQLTDRAFLGGAERGLAWDPVRDQAWRVERVVPSGVGEEDFDAHEWKLVTYREGGDGTWSKQYYDLPGFGPGLNETGYSERSRLRTPTLATASDGSLIVLGTDRFETTDPEVPVPTTVPAAYRLVFFETEVWDPDREEFVAAEMIDAQPLPTPEVPAEGGAFESVQTAPGGNIVLINAGRGGKQNLVHCRIAPNSLVGCDDAVSVTAGAEPQWLGGGEWNYAIDPADGTVWYGGAASQKLAAFKGGRFAGADVFSVRNPRGGPVAVGDDHFVYAQTNDGSPAEFSGSKSWGFAKFERVGFTPTVTAEPAPQTISLTATQSSQPVSFESEATGDPAPSRQWQQRRPGETRFTDVAGASAQTLPVTATRALDGTEYRAVYENAAGRVASDPATLAVHYAPAIAADITDVSAEEGEAAEISLLATGSPEPQVTWQRRVGGFWQDIAAGDDNFSRDGATLTVLETNIEQSGSLFRARVANPVASVYSGTAKLTVTPRSAGPVEAGPLHDASLEWLGNLEMQSAPPFGGSNYFSAGISGGNEASYRASEGNAAIYQRSAAGVETLATYATRAAHVAGGGRQVARLFGGEGELEADGSARIDWDAAFSVNFYGGLVPFTISDPELVVDGDGSGELTATLSGCASSIQNPNECTPLPSQEVVVATFSGATVEPGEVLTMTPDYAGVEVTLPTGMTQNRSTAGWGAWPQSFVDFQLLTGLSSYWYSSGGGADPKKPPLPFAVEFEAGAAPPTEPPPGPGPEGPLVTPPSPPAQSTPPAGGGVSAPGQTAAAAGPTRPARIALPGGSHELDRSGRAQVATLACPPGAGACEVIVPERVAVRIAGKRYLLAVLAPSRLAAGKSAAVRVRLPRAARTALGADRVTLRLRIVVRAGERVAKRDGRVTIVGQG